MLLSYGDKLALDMKTQPIIDRKSVEDAYVQIQKSQCGALYASTRDLKELSNAMKRDAVSFGYSSIWISGSEIDAADRRAQEKKALATQQATERKQRAEDERKLRDQRRADENSTKAAQQRELRVKYEPSAKAAASALGEEVKNWTANRSGSVGLVYSKYAAWLQDKFADHWEVASINAELADFGSSNWKGRMLDTPFTRISMRLRNKMLGEYQDACFLFGRINDAEFSMTREPAFASCDDRAEIDRWKVGHQFQSKWIVD